MRAAAVPGGARIAPAGRQHCLKLACAEPVQCAQALFRKSIERLRANILVKGLLQDIAITGENGKCPVDAGVFYRVARRPSFKLTNKARPNRVQHIAHRA